MSSADVLEKVETKVKVPRKFKVVIHNDNATPMDFVVQLLITHFNKDPADAIQLTVEVHEVGKGIAGIYSKEIANQKVIEATREAQSFGFPLKLTSEPI